MVEMSSECFTVYAARGMSMVILHNGGGVGIGKVSNSDFGIVLDGSKRGDEILKLAFPWDVICGVDRCAWSRNENSIETVSEHIKKLAKPDHITLPFVPEEALIKRVVKEKLNL